jgi:hypothetical protein
VGTVSASRGSSPGSLSGTPDSAGMCQTSTFFLIAWTSAFSAISKVCAMGDEIMCVMKRASRRKSSKNLPHCSTPLADTLPSCTSLLDYDSQQFITVQEQWIEDRGKGRGVVYSSMPHEMDNDERGQLIFVE